MRDDGGRTAGGTLTRSSHPALSNGRAWKRTLTRVLPALAGACCALMALAPHAFAHAVIQPTASRPAEQQVYTLTVPSERDSEVVSVAIQVPPDIDSLLVEKKPGWRAALEREGDRIAVVRWSGGRIEPDHYDSFRFIARNPVQAGELEWKVIQRYTDATDRWIGPADSEQPAPRTNITEQAQPQDVINTESGTVETQQAGAETPAADSGGGDGDSNTVPIIIGAVALVAALAALGIALTSRRRSAT
jgi:uncharacterized protein YcnI